MAPHPERKKTQKIQAYLFFGGASLPIQLIPFSIKAHSQAAWGGWGVLKTFCLNDKELLSQP